MAARQQAVGEERRGSRIARLRGALAIAVAAAAIAAVSGAWGGRGAARGEPGRLVQLWESNADLGIAASGVSPPAFLDWKEHGRVFELLGAFEPDRSVRVGAGPEDQPAVAARVSSDVVPLLGVVPELGRTFLPEEDWPDAGNRLILLGHNLWSRRFGAHPAVVGRTIELDGERYRCIGVMPEGFGLPGSKAELWTPLALDAYDASRQDRRLCVVGLLRHGVSLDQARRRMEELAAQLAEANPDESAGWGVSVAPVGRPPALPHRHASGWLPAAALGSIVLIGAALAAQRWRSVGRREMMLRPARAV
jgi:putative ABC transport system permease protein